MRTEQTKRVPVRGALPRRRVGAAQCAPRAPLRRVWRFARHKPLGAVGGIIVLYAASSRRSLPRRSRRTPTTRARERTPARAIPAHILGTDNLGRDMFSRIVYGARISVAVGFGAVLVGTGLAADPRHHLRLLRWHL